MFFLSHNPRRLGVLIINFLFRKKKLFRSLFSCPITFGLTFVLFLFCPIFFVLLLSLKPRPLVQLFFDTHAPRQPHAVTQQLSAPFFYFFSFFFVFLVMLLFPSIFVPLQFPLCMESSTLYFSPPGRCFSTL